MEQVSRMKKIIVLFYTKVEVVHSLGGATFIKGIKGKK
jgi:hypothetical protein